MVDEKKYAEHTRMQDIARATMGTVQESIRPGDTLASVRERAEASLLDLGADSFWYWGIGALVFSGRDTVVSVSGRDYQTADHLIEHDDIITIDLSPQRRGVWGDFARTIVIEDGRVLGDPAHARDAVWREGIAAEHALHRALVEIATPIMTFEDLHARMNERIGALGFENLDFLGNVGHSVERDSADRVYIEAGNAATLESVDLFTFEPHIRMPGTGFGFKREDIYTFRNGSLVAL